MQKYYEEIEEIGNSTFVLMADDVMIGEMVRVDKRDGTHLYGSVISFDGKKVIVQAAGSTRGLRTGDRATFLKRMMRVKVGDQLLGRVLNASGKPIDGGPDIEGLEIDTCKPPVNPVKRIVPHKMISTGIPLIDVFNTLVKSQKIPIFSVPGEPYNALLMRIANQTDADVVVLGLMAARNDELYAFMENARKTGSLQKTVMFVHMATDYAVECLLVPDMALTVAEQFAQQGKSVMVLLTDMTSFADAGREIAISLGQIPSNRGYPGTLYSDLASRYEKAVDIAGLGSITILAVTTMPADDVTHPVPDNTGYITEGQFYLKHGVINPFGSLSRLKNNVINGPQSRGDHGEIMNTMIRLYAEALKARELDAMGFSLSKWDEKLLKYGRIFEEKMMDLEVNIPLLEALDLGWEILAECFESQELGMKKELVKGFWKK